MISVLKRKGRTLARSALRSWARSGLVPGYNAWVIDRIGAQLAEPEPLPCRVPGGTQIGCQLRDRVQRWTWFYGCHEPIEAQLFCRMIKPGMTVIDVGANVGLYTLLAATAIGESGQVHSFEPVPETFRRLVQAVELNSLSNVHLNCMGLWSEPGSLSLGVPEGFSEDEAGYFSIRKSADGSERCEVEVTTLDAYVKAHGLRVDAMKMDIEGAEPEALAGAQETLASFQPTILIEINPDVLVERGSSVEILWQQVAPHGYRALLLGQSPAECRVARDASEITHPCNAILHTRDLPENVTSGWSLSQASRWARESL